MPPYPCDCRSITLNRENFSFEGLTEIGAWILRLSEASDCLIIPDRTVRKLDLLPEPEEVAFILVDQVQLVQGDKRSTPS